MFLYQRKYVKTSVIAENRSPLFFPGYLLHVISIELGLLIELWLFALASVLNTTEQHNNNSERNLAMKTQEFAADRPQIQRNERSGMTQKHPPLDLQ